METTVTNQVIKTTEPYSLTLLAARNLKSRFWPVGTALLSDGFRGESL